MCHFLCNTQHQGRHLTEYAIRTAGFLVFGWNATNHLFISLEDASHAKNLTEALPGQKWQTFLGTD